MLLPAKFSRKIAVVAVLFLALAISGNDVGADSGDIDRLFKRLRTAEPGEVQAIENQIIRAWSDPGSPSLRKLFWQGKAAMAKGDLPEAIKRFSTLVNRAPAFAEGWNARATSYFLMRQYTQSVADIGMTLELNSRHFGAMNGLAMILEQVGDHEGALAVYRELLAIHPTRRGVQKAIERLEMKTADPEA